MRIGCSICLGEIFIDTSTPVTPCRHVFHRPCLTRWLESSRTCPKCRRRVTVGSLRNLFLEEYREVAGGSGASATGAGSLNAVPADAAVPAPANQIVEMANRMDVIESRVRALEQAVGAGLPSASVEVAAGGGSPLAVRTSEDSGTAGSTPRWSDDDRSVVTYVLTDDDALSGLGGGDSDFFPETDADGSGFGSLILSDSPGSPYDPEPDFDSDTSYRSVSSLSPGSSSYSSDSVRDVRRSSSANARGSSAESASSSHHRSRSRSRSRRHNRSRTRSRSRLSSPSPGRRRRSRRTSSPSSTRRRTTTSSSSSPSPIRSRSASRVPVLCNLEVLTMIVRHFVHRGVLSMPARELAEAVNVSRRALRSCVAESCADVFRVRASAGGGDRDGDGGSRRGAGRSARGRSDSDLWSSRRWENVEISIRQNLSVCEKYTENPFSGCRGRRCTKLHICRDFVLNGRCVRARSCRQGHRTEIFSSHNKRVVESQLGITLSDLSWNPALDLVKLCCYR